MKHDAGHLLLNHVEIRAIKEALKLTGATELATYPIDDRGHFGSLLVATSRGLIRVDMSAADASGSITPWRKLKADFRWQTPPDRFAGSLLAGDPASTVGTIEFPDLELTIEWTRNRAEEWSDFWRIVGDQTMPERMEAGT